MELCFFCRSFLTWTDVGSLVAQWILFGLLAADVEYWQNDSLWRLFEACSVIRVFRVFRIFRLAKHYTGLQILCPGSASKREGTDFSGNVCWYWDAAICNIYILR